jgi:hypothetical protein
MKKKVIDPEIVNILCGDSSHNYKSDSTPPPKNRKSFWGKIGSFLKKAWAYVLPIVTTVTMALNAVSRFKEANNRTRASNQGA